VDQAQRLQHGPPMDPGRPPAKRRHRRPTNPRRLSRKSRRLAPRRRACPPSPKQTRCRRLLAPRRRARTGAPRTHRGGRGRRPRRRFAFGRREDSRRPHPADLAASAPAQRASRRVARRRFQLTAARDHFEAALKLDGPADRRGPARADPSAGRDSSERQRGLALLRKWTDHPASSTTASVNC